jgi:hypothetical protein
MKTIVKVFAVLSLNDKAILNPDSLLEKLKEDK